MLVVRRGRVPDPESGRRGIFRGRAGGGPDKRRAAPRRARAKRAPRTAASWLWIFLSGSSSHPQVFEGIVGPRSFFQSPSQVRSRGGAAFYAAEPTEAWPGAVPRRETRPKARDRAPRRLGIESSFRAQAVIVGSSRGSWVRSLSFSGLPRSGVGEARPFTRPSRRRPGRTLSRGAKRGRRPAPALRGSLAIIYIII